MEEPFIGEARPASFTFPSKGRALRDGLLLPINQNRALFSLLGSARSRQPSKGGGASAVPPAPLDPVAERG